jgi:hypothetical protein
MSSALVGKTSHHRYASGLSYMISFREKCSSPILSLRCLQISRSDDYWLTTGRVGHVTLVYDLEKKILNASALMPGKFELFEETEIECQSSV